MACLPFRGRTARLYLRLYAPRRGLEAVLSACLGGRVPLPSFVAPAPSSARSLRSPCLGRSCPTLRSGHILDPQPRPAVACRNCGSIITSGHIIRRPCRAIGIMCNSRRNCVTLLSWSHRSSPLNSRHPCHRYPLPLPLSLPKAQHRRHPPPCHRVAKAPPRREAWGLGGDLLQVPARRCAPTC